MEMFVTNAEVIHLQTGLSALAGYARLFSLLRLAWYLGERDTRRALTYADEVEILCHRLGLEPRQKNLVLARVLLVRGNAKWLFSESDVAEQLTSSALKIFQDERDGCGCADAYWLLAWGANTQGKAQQRNHFLSLGLQKASAAADWARMNIIEAELARFDTYSDVTAAKLRWGRHFPDDLSQLPLGVAACINEYLSLAASRSGDYGRSTALGMATFDAALKTGQIRRAISACTKIGDDFNSLNDHHAALDWMQRGLDLARPTEWPGSIGAVLTETAGTLRRLGRLEPAQELLSRALDILSVLPCSRSYAIALEYMGTLALDRGDYALAMKTFSRLQERGEGLNQSDVKWAAQCGQAHALLELNRPDEAFAAGQAALLFAQAQTRPPAAPARPGPCR